MSDQTPIIPEDSVDIAKKIGSGEFFRESMNAYKTRYIDLISERYFFLGLFAFSMVILLISLIAMALLYPLNQNVPFIYRSSDTIDELPAIRSIKNGQEDPNAAIQYFLVSNYIKLRESYDIDTLDRNANGIKTQSTDQVYSEYQAMIDPQNPASPITLYQRQGVKNVKIDRLNLVSQGQERKIEGDFTVTITTPEVSKKEPRHAIITFRFDDIHVDPKTGDLSPLHFTVTSYKSEAVGS